MELFIVMSYVVLVSGTFNYNMNYGTFGIRGTIEGPPVIGQLGHQGNSMIHRISYPDSVSFRPYNVKPPIGTVRYITNGPGGNHGEYTYHGPSLPVPTGKWNPSLTPNNFISGETTGLNRRDGTFATKLVDAEKPFTPGNMGQSFDRYGPKSLVHKEAIPVGFIRHDFVHSTNAGKHRLHDSLTGFPTRKNYVHGSAKFESGNDLPQFSNGKFQSVGFGPLHPVGNMVRLPNQGLGFDRKHPVATMEAPVRQGHFRYRGTHNILGHGGAVGLPTGKTGGPVMLPSGPPRIREWEYSSGAWGGKLNMLPGQTWGDNGVRGKLSLHPGALSNMFVDRLRTY